MEDKTELTVLSGKNVEHMSSATKKPRNKTFLDFSKLRKINVKKKTIHFKIHSQQLLKFSQPGQLNDQFITYF
jgi:hypothetical protein